LFSFYSFFIFHYFHFHREPEKPKEQDNHVFIDDAIFNRQERSSHLIKNQPQSFEMSHILVFVVSFITILFLATKTVCFCGRRFCERRRRELLRAEKIDI